MFIAMNRFKVASGAEAAFEEVWSSRRTRLDEMPGFIAFHLLKGPEREDHVLYSSHTSWASKADFTAWTQSEQFRASHRNAGQNRSLYLGPPEFEGFETVLSETARMRGGAADDVSSPRSVKAQPQDATSTLGPKPVFGVVGLGSMGMGAALSALRGGFETWGCDPRAAVREAFERAGGHTAPTPAALAARCDVVQVLVVNAAQTEEVLFGADGLAGALRPGSVVITSATVDPALPPLWAGKLEALGVHLIDGPVSGGAVKAAQGEMTVMASGKAEALALAAPILAAIAGKVYHLGEKAGIGSTVKMVNQHLAGVHIAAACEAMALGMRAGADPQQLYDVICNSAGMSWMFQNRVPHILAGDYAPLSAVNIFVKDLGIVLDAARKMQFPLPLASSAHQLYLATAAMGHGAEDDAAVIKHYAAMAGLALPEPAARQG